MSISLEQYKLILLWVSYHTYLEIYILAIKISFVKVLLIVSVLFRIILGILVFIDFNLRLFFLVVVFLIILLHTLLGEYKSKQTDKINMKVFCYLLK